MLVLPLVYLLAQAGYMRKNEKTGVQSRIGHAKNRIISNTCMTIKFISY